MYTFFEIKDMDLDTKDIFGKIKTFPVEELYRVVVDGTLHTKENGWVGYEKREPGCLKAFFDAFLFICQNKNDPLTVEYIQTIHALCSAYNEDVSKLGRPPGKLYTYLYVNHHEALEKCKYDHTFTIPHERATIAGITQYLDQITKNPYRILGRLIYEGTEIIPGAFGKKGNNNLAEWVLKDMHTTGKYLRYHAPRTGIYESISMIVDSYQKDISQVQTKEEKLYSIAKHIQLFEKLHPFPDENGRTFVNALLNRMLMQNGFTLAIFEEPNLFDLYSVSELVEVIKDAIENGRKITQGHSLFNFDTQTMSAREKGQFAQICHAFIEGITPEKEKKYQELYTRFKLENYLEHQYQEILHQHALVNKNEIEIIKKQYPGYSYDRLFKEASGFRVVQEAEYLQKLYLKLKYASESKITITDLQYQLEIDLMKMLRDTPKNVFSIQSLHNFLPRILLVLDDIETKNSQLKESQDTGEIKIRV